MAHRTLLPGVFVMLSACSPAYNTSPDGAAPIDASDVGALDAEAGADLRDVSSPDTAAPSNPTDAPVDSVSWSDGDGGGNDGHVASDPEGGLLDSDAHVLDGDAAPLDGDAPPLSCEWTHERLSFAVTLPGGIHDCPRLPTDGGRQLAMHELLSGVVRANTTHAGTSSVLTIDTCVSDGCGAQIATIDVKTPTPFTVPVGAYVEAEYWIEPSFMCTYFLRISNLPEWNGRKNPISDVAKTYLVASDGFSAPTSKMASTGIAVSPTRLGCATRDGGSCGTQVPLDSYTFEFSASGSPALTVPMGQSLPWVVSGQNVIVRNHRSYESGKCDDYWNWAFTILGQ